MDIKLNWGDDVEEPITLTCPYCAGKGDPSTFTFDCGNSSAWTVDPYMVSVPCTCGTCGSAYNFLLVIPHV